MIDILIVTLLGIAVLIMNGFVFGFLIMYIRERYWGFALAQFALVLLTLAFDLVLLSCCGVM